jgi:hypothetical protein
MTSLHQFLFKKTAPSVRPDQSVVSVWYVNEVGRVVARSSAAEGRQRRAGSNDNSPLGSYSTTIDASKERKPSARSSHDIDNNHFPLHGQAHGPQFSLPDPWSLCPSLVARVSHMSTESEFVIALTRPIQTQGATVDPPLTARSFQ